MLLHELSPGSGCSFLVVAKESVNPVSTNNMKGGRGAVAELEGGGVAELEEVLLIPVLLPVVGDASPDEVEGCL